MRSSATAEDTASASFAGMNETFLNVRGREHAIDAVKRCWQSLFGARTGRREFVDSGRRAVYALALLATGAFAILEVAFLRSDFSYNVVAAHSSTTTPTFYKLAAAWSSQEGSLLLWVLLLSLWSSLILFLTRHRAREIAPYATAVLLGFGAFFTSLAVFFANPFATSARPELGLRWNSSGRE